MTHPSFVPEILETLQHGAFNLEGQFMWGSNYTYLSQIELNDMTLKAVYKPVQGERPLWDFPEETLAGREVAAFIISEVGGWHLVPPTVYRKDGPAGAGSLQLFVEHDPEHHYFHFEEEEKERLRPVALFDAVINNTDRKGGHILVDPEERFWLIDHGICFHAVPKLRTVIWDFAGEPLTDEMVMQLKALREALLDSGGTPFVQLNTFLSKGEIGATIARIDKLLATCEFPRPTSQRYSYPWPPV